MRHKSSAAMLVERGAIYVSAIGRAVALAIAEHS